MSASSSTSTSSAASSSSGVGAVDVSNKTLTGSDFFGFARNGDVNGVARFVRRGADVNARLQGSTALMEGSAYGHLPVVQYLLRKGAEPNIKSSSGVTALHLASFGGHESVVTALIDNGADVSLRDYVRRQSPLMFAVVNRHENVAICLVEYGSQLDLKDAEGKTALDYCDEEFAAVLTNCFEESVAQRERERIEAERTAEDQKAREEEMKEEEEKAARAANRKSQTVDKSSRRRKKDPNKPKKALSAFMFFSSHFRPQVKLDHPEFTFGDIGRFLGASWKEATDEEKELFYKQAEQDRIRYALAVEAYVPSNDYD